MLLPLFGKNVLLIYAPDVADLWPTEGISPARRKSGERDDARHSQVVVLKGTRKKVLCVGALHPLYSDLPTPGVLIEIEGESFQCVCGVGSYLIHSPRVLPTPRGDYFTANGRVEHGGYRERGKGRELWRKDNGDGTRFAPEIDVSSRTSRSKQIVSMRVDTDSPRGEERDPWHFSDDRVLCVTAPWRQHRINEITILYSLVQFFKPAVFKFPVFKFPAFCGFFFQRYSKTRKRKYNRNTDCFKQLFAANNSIEKYNSCVVVIKNTIYNI